LGIIDRGTNIIEIKPVTQCNLRCKYCFVSAGEYCQNFALDLDYLMAGVQQLVDLKGAHDLEVHVAPYGEAMLFPALLPFVQQVAKVPGVATISMQTNGLMLDEAAVDALAAAGLTRLNISLNTFDPAKAAELAGVDFYDMDKLVALFDYILTSPVDLLLAPVWFPKVNDEDMVDIIQYVKGKRAGGFSDTKLRLGIQKYLTYKTGRKLGHIRPKTWLYFYDQLRSLEKVHGIKLILSPTDFGIHRREHLTVPVAPGERVEVEILMQGRFPNEWIGRIGEEWAVKVLSRGHYEPGTRVPVTIEKAKAKENLLTGFVR
jgi:hypothetical protein